jgi:hypothetical protein
VEWQDVEEGDLEGTNLGDVEMVAAQSGKVNVL